MLERLAAWFLNTYVAEYVGNIDTDQLSIGLLKGAVELEKLPLKRDSLKKLNLPFDIKGGYIGKLKLQIPPVRYIKSQPWVVQIDKLYIIAGPPSEPEAYNAEEEERQTQAQKQAKLDKLEQQWKADQQKSNSWWFWSTFSVTFPSSVIENLQVIVDDVHIRYEDTEANPSQPFAVGVTLENMSAQSTDEDWEPKFVSGGSKARKLVDLKGFSVYFDTEILGELEGQQLEDAMLRKKASVKAQEFSMTTSTMDGLQSSVQYVVKPVNGQAKLTRNSSKLPLKISDGARFHLEVQLEKIPITLSDQQYELMVELFDVFNLRVKARKYRQWRPASRVMESPRDWWKFAISSTLNKIREKNERRSKSFALKRAHQNVLYVEGYILHLTLGIMSEEVIKELREIEKEQSFEELAALRKVAMDQVKKQRGPTEVTKENVANLTENNQGILQRWFPGWMSGYQPGTASPSPDGESSTENMAADISAEEDELLNELGYESQDDLLRRDRIFLTLSFSLVGGSLQLVTMPTSMTGSFFGPEPLVELAFESLCFSADLRPKLRYASFDLSLGSLTLQDHSDTDSLFPVLVQPVGAKVETMGRAHLFQRQYTVLDPLDSAEESSLFVLKTTVEDVSHQKLYQVQVHSKPLDIVYNPATIFKVKEFVSRPMKKRQTMRELGSHTTAELRNRIGDMFEGDSKVGGHRLLSIQLDISAPHVILPENFHDKDTSLVILDLGHVTFVNVPDWSADNLTTAVNQEVMDINEDDDDVWQTPPSSPPSEQEEIGGTPFSQPVKPAMLQSAIHSLSTLLRLRNDPFERYSLSLSDFQILVGKVNENWREVTRSGQSSLHLLDKFTLSVRIQKMLKFVPDRHQANLNVAASLPSLSFHIDEDKVHTLISCFRAMKVTSEKPKSSSPESDTPTTMTSSIYQSAYSLESFDLRPEPSMGVSMYQSAVESFLKEVSIKDEESFVSSPSNKMDTIISAKGGDKERGVARDRLQRRTSVVDAMEKLLVAKLSIDEALLSISSKGRVITELNMPGVSFEFLKRPYDTAVRLLLSDLCLVDRIQKFGPEYELVVCSSGRALLGLSPFSSSTTKSSSFNQTMAASEDKSSQLLHPNSSQDVFGSSPSFKSLESISTGVFSESHEDLSGMLLALTYTYVSPCSPEHPAMKDLDQEERSVDLDKEADIHKINLTCTAVDALANQETIVELIDFFQRALPDNVVAKRSDVSQPTNLQETKTKESKKPLQTEVNVKFERVGIRLLQRCQPRTFLETNTADKKIPPSRLVASIMLYGLAAEGRISADMAINGKLEGVHITDLTPEGKKYADILKMGLKKESLVFSPGGPSQGGDTCLSFSISHSARSAASAFQPHPVSDVHINVFVPAIYYTHSVNLVYELEIFISELQLQSSHVTSSFRTAAVGVAKGIVSEKSRLTERLIQLHSSFGHMTSHVSFSQDEGEDEPDLGTSRSPLSDRIYLDISVQSPVIVVPRSLRRDECLVAHLGEIMLKNEFVQKGEFPTDDKLMTSSFYVDTSPEVDRIMLKINNVSLHSTHTQVSREWLLTSHQDSSSSSIDGCFKVLKETSLLVQIDRRLQKPDNDSDGNITSEEGYTGMDDRVIESDADIIVSGEMCDPLLINLPKEVFDQIRATLKHSIRRSPPKFAKRNMSAKFCEDGLKNDSEGSSLTSKLLARTVRFNPNVQLERQEDKLPKIFASFRLPKLSLKLKHTLDERETNLVFVSFEDFSLQCTKSDPHVTSFDLALKSIIIEDLLQPENSEYRYILASSSKPLPFISPVPSPTRSLRKFSKSASLASSFSRRLFPVTHLMSTPKPPTPTRSPLRCFSPSTSLQNSSDQSNLKYSSDSVEDQSASTLKDEDTAANVSEIGDLLTIKAFHVSQNCPIFKSKYNSVSINAAVDFSSVFVIINLQTWVLLFDYLGIGIPTPPPSRPSTPEPPHLDSNTDQDTTPQKNFDPQTFTQYRSDSELNFETQMTQSSLFTSAVDQSILEDARDMASIGSNGGVGMFSNSSQSYPVREGGEASETERQSLRPDSLSFDSLASFQDKNELDSQSGVWGVEGKTSMEIGLNVKSLTVTFNKQEHPLAKGNVSSVTAQVKTNKGNLEISGTLGQASVMDLTETGAFYRERFTTSGEQALTFKIFKYGRPDPKMERPFDIRAEVNMGSVRYLHTMRFLKETLAFVSHFPQLIDAFQRMKAMAQGNLVYLGPERKARISLDVDIVGPVLLIPKHAFSPDLMVGDIGRVRVTNLARYDGQEGTLSHMRNQQGLDTMVSITGSAYGDPNSPHKPKLSPQSSVQCQFTTVSVDSMASRSVTSPLETSQILSPSWFSRHTPFPSLRSSWVGHPHPHNMDNSIFGSFQSGISSFIEKDRQRIEEKLEEFKGPCLLDCIEVELTEVDVFSAKKVRSEDGGNSIVRQPGQVLKEKGAAKIYIERNLYEDFCRDVPDLHIEGTLEAIHAMIDKSQLDIIKSLIDMNLGEPIEEFEKPSTVIRDPIAQPVAADVWTGFLFRMRFVGVTLELLQSRETDSPGSLTRSLARFDIQDSELTFESRSNQCKTVDFTSHSVIGYDTRFEGYDMSVKPSVFDKVLQPRFSQHKKKKTIQVEIHVSMSPKEIKASILLNKLRLIGIFDVILELKSFILDKLPESGDEDNFNEVDAPSTTAAANSLRQQLTTHMARKPQEDNKPPRNVVVKLSVTETDFVVVEDMTSLDSNAVVLKGTVILKFHQKPSKEKNINCSIDGLELFSCSLSNEDETALSILDPVSISVDVYGQRRSDNECSAVGQTLEVEIQQLNCRLSYNDIKLFLSIAQSLPRLESQEQREDNPVEQGQKEVDDALVKRLLPLGFTKTAIRKELFLSDNNPDAAALKLLTEQEEQDSEELASSEDWEDVEGVREVEREKPKEAEKPFTIKSIEVRLGSLSVCLIDDSVNRDVPLLDFSLTDLQAEHSLLTDKNGKARAIFAGDYYNRNISAWEPVVEPWKFELCWKTVTKYSTDLDSNDRPDRMSLALLSQEQLLVNVTSSLIHILKVTQASWSQDLKRSEDLVRSSSIEPVVAAHRRTGSGRVVLEDGSLGDPQSKAISKMERGLALLHSVRFVSQTRQRSKFIPFLVRNNTGLPLHFATLTSVPSKVYVSPSALYEKTRVGRGTQRGVSSTELKRTSEWMEVSVGEEKPFDFCSKSKIRHRDTRALIVHQLLVKITGWQPIDIPVSVDKIGVFFREVWPSSDEDIDSIPHLSKNRSPVRLVFAISLSDTQKVVNIRSALVLHNTMEIPLEVKLERPDADPHKDSTSLSPSGDNGSVNLPPLSPHGYLAVPLHLLSWSIRVRPQGWGLQYCSKHLAWKHVASKLPTSHMRGCDPIGEEEDPTFRFCVSVQRENYPSDSTPNYTHPAHTLTLYPPLAVVNLLPCDAEFILLSHSSKIRKMIYRGKQIALYSVDSMKPIDFTIAMEGFKHSQGCTVSLENIGIPQSMALEDSDGRPLRLTVNSEMMGGCALKVTISCSYWLINRTGLPLVFRQEGVGYKAVGQHEEHERASTTTPLLFSYSAGEFIEKCTMRLGEAFCSLRGGQSTWCSPFAMISDCGVRRLFMRSRDGRPDSEYQVGVEIQRGRRQYGLTRVVTFVARYQLENRTQYKLAYLQRHQLHNQEQLTMTGKIPIIMPRAIMAFHWPRNDLDQLLCIRVQDIDCQWSGGFPLDNDNSFHVHMRGRYSHSVFLRCNISLKGATYHVIFSDAANYPSPFRLENLSQIAVTYYQSSVGRSSLVALLNPGQSVPYAWDEPTLAEKLSIEVKGAKECKEFDFERFGPRGKLYYECYFYITAVATFHSDEGSSMFRGTLSSPAMAYHRRYDEHSCELVLDVPQGTAVIFQKKDPERRSQLWRMSASRQLVNIDSSDISATNMVLDIVGGRLPTSREFVSLCLNKANSVRTTTQSWRFSEDGRLLLDAMPTLCVQSRPGYEALREGADAVLGGVSDSHDLVPSEQLIRRLKHSPGSGVLSVNVISDGPTRTLRITDENKKYSHTTPRDDWIVVDSGQIAPLKTSDVDSCHDNSWDSEEEDSSSIEVELSLVLEQGVGVSLINSVPEELLFATLKGIRVEFISTTDQQCLNATIQHIQVDNQLATCVNPVLAYPSPDPAGSHDSSYPVIKLCVEKVPHKSPFTVVFKTADVKLRGVTLLLEERLLFKILQWAGVGQAPHEAEAKEEEFMNLLTRQTVSPSSSEASSRQLYMEDIKISDVEFQVSMLTTSQLPDDLKRIKRHLGFPLIQFESPIYLREFHQSHILGNTAALLDAFQKHYKEALKSQAFALLGSVDFLGNPVGLLSDVATGVSGMVSLQPDVVGLVRNVAHGVSNTTSKLTGTVSHVLGKATFDSSFQEERQQLIDSCQTSGDHFKAGVMGFASGVFGGATSLITQPYKGAQDSGLMGFVGGMLKGAVGTVAKPVAGLFDFASGTTAALRETTSRFSRHNPSPVRLRRSCVGASGALTTYSMSQSRGQEYLLRLTDGKLSEKLVSYELLYENMSNRRERMKVIISSQYLYFFQDSPPDPSTVNAKISLDELAECRSAIGKSSIPTVYIVLSLIHKEAGYSAPKYKCFDEKSARKVAQLINYAKSLHEEEKLIVRTLRLQHETIW